MWNQREAPLQILQNPSLGDALFAMEEGWEHLPEVEVGPPEASDLRLEALEGWVGVLEARIARLEAQTPSAYYRRLIAALRGLWARLRATVESLWR